MVYIVGAGPGATDLITVRGQKIISLADVIIYAGSLVNPRLLDTKKESCTVYDSAGMTLEEIIQVITDSTGTIVRLHTGDPSLYGAIREQMEEMDKRGIPYQIVPGVSSFCAAAAVLNKEYTVPGVTQTVIITRMEGRTDVPTDENIAALASLGATMVIFLSVQMVDKLAQQLMNGYSKDTPVAVVYKATWDDQKIIRSTLADVAQKVKQENINKTALIAIGDFLGDDYQLSKLYDKNFAHQYRKSTHA